MKPVWYTAREKFGPGTRGWLDYLVWARLPQLVEVVSLDSSLCGSLIKELLPEDWAHNVQADYRIDFFTDLDYLRLRAGGSASASILAVIEEPDIEDLNSFRDGQFIFIGFDLVEIPGTGISALSNCGGFIKAFLPRDINPFGLVSDYALARTIQQRLVEQYPEEQHANCSLWGIWRME
jgi:hypothetical protein